MYFQQFKILGVWQGLITSYNFLIRNAKNELNMSECQDGAKYMISITIYTSYYHFWFRNRSPVRNEYNSQTTNLPLWHISRLKSLLRSLIGNDLKLPVAKSTTSAINSSPWSVQTFIPFSVLTSCITISVPIRLLINGNVNNFKWKKKPKDPIREHLS